MSQPQWYVRIADEVLGPISGAELKDLAEKGAIGTDTQISQDGSTWMETGQVSSITVAPRTMQPAPTRIAQNKNLTIQQVWLVGGIVLGGLGILMCGGLLLVIMGAVAGSGERLETAASPEGPQTPGSRFVAAQAADASVDEGPRYQVPNAARRPVATASMARLALRCVDATDELLPIAQRLSQQEQAALGIMALATGMDIYGARVSMTNTGSVPIRVYPQNLRVHFGNETAVVYTINDLRFLRPTVLQPGASTSGLVTYTARMDIGASMRLGRGGMSYDDSTIEVAYQ